MLWFRSKKRDQHTDVARLVPIDAVQRARREAEAELAGLRGRLATEGEQAAWLVGDDYIQSNTVGDPSSERRLSEIEEFVRRGRHRERYLDDQIAALKQIFALFSGSIDSDADATERK